MQAPGWRLEVAELNPGAAAKRRADSAVSVLGEAGSGVGAIEATAIYFVDRDLDVSERTQLVEAIVADGTHVGTWKRNVATALPPGEAEVVLRPGVTDSLGVAVERVADLLGLRALSARSGTRYIVVPNPTGPLDPDASDQRVTTRTVVDALLHNPVVDEVSYDTTVVPRFDVADPTSIVEVITVRGRDAASLATLSSERGLALDPEELVIVQSFFDDIGRDPTDAELEMIAQTWSEHCSHKTFRAAIIWDDGTPVTGLLTQLRTSTEKINASWVKSAFVDNAGIVAFDDAFDLAVKVETHNHPSAIEPFGGANTGVGGVIRDVMGVAADPVAVTDVLCFGPSDTAASTLPAGVLHPSRIAAGVIAGVGDYGNKFGVPTVAGAVVSHEGFIANPLVYCGCIGLRPADLVLPGPAAGDRIVSLGGATGRDGIRGATFSSATMDATTGDVAGASVQIGDPITERLVADVICDARDAGLFTAITDCGAGGFSSAVGEIAAVLGADVDLDSAPRKYPGLAPWEVWLSEAQERMVLAVPPAHADALRGLCDDHGVSFADLGAFRDDGRLVVRCDGQLLVDLPGSFLHDGRPKRRLTASRPVAPAPTGTRADNAVEAAAGNVLLDVLAHPDVRSNADIVRGFDHEILGATVGRPYLGAADDGPGDAAVIAPIQSPSGRGFAIGIGVNCRTGDYDARRMAEAVVDEAIRNVVAVGADPDRIALLDNFSWGDPRVPATLGRLVEAVEGCCIAANAHGAPFVSGKDSLNNEYLTADGVRRAIPPTLVITALGQLPDATRLVTSDAKRADGVLMMLGTTREELRGSVLDASLGRDGGGRVPGGDPEAPQRYRALHHVMRAGLVRSAHDVSDGGLAVTLAEMAIGGRLGLTADVALPADVSVTAALFSESSGRIVIEVDPSNVDQVTRLTGATTVGHLRADDLVQISVDGRRLIDVTVTELVRAWAGHHAATEATQATKATQATETTGVQP